MLPYSATFTIRDVKQLLIDRGHLVETIERNLYLKFRGKALDSDRLAQPPLSLDLKLPKRAQSS